MKQKDGLNSDILPRPFRCNLLEGNDNFHENVQVEALFCCGGWHSSSGKPVYDLVWQEKKLEICARSNAFSIQLFFRDA